MDEENLIALVQQHECLYNLRHCDYDNNLKKDNIWKEIGNQLNAKVEDCKSKWVLLRSYYRRAINRRKTVSGQAAKKQKKWRFEDQMEFLKLYLQERDQLSNIQSEEQPDVQDDGDDDFMTDNNSTPSSISAASSHPPNKRKHNSDDLAGKLGEFITIKTQPKKEENTGKKRLMVFFDDVAESMLKFSELDQVQMKREIFNIVSNKEIEILRQKESAAAAGCSAVLPTMEQTTYHTLYPPQQYFNSPPFSLGNAGNRNNIQ